MKQLLLIFLIALFATISCSAPNYYEKNHDEPEYVVIYSTSWCGWCKVAKEFFEKNNITYIEKNFEDPSDRKELMELAKEWGYDPAKLNGVPIILVKRKIVIGYNPKRILSLLGRVSDFTWGHDMITPGLSPVELAE